jgi:hypothetical protein
LRLRSDIWVAAYLRRTAVEGAYAVLRKRGAAEAGAIYVLVARADGLTALYAPGPTDPDGSGERRWFRAHTAEWVDAAASETHLKRELKRDPDLWVIEVESRDGSHWLNLVPN